MTGCCVSATGVGTACERYSGFPGHQLNNTEYGKYCELKVG